MYLESEGGVSNLSHALLAIIIIVSSHQKLMKSSAAVRKTREWE